MGVRRGSLQRRITLAITLGMSIILLSFAVVSYYIIRKNIEDSLNKKLAVGRLIKDNIDNLIRENVNRLFDISLSGSIDLSDNDLSSERNALNTAYRYSIFTDGIFLLDRSGNVVLNYPERLKDISINLMSVEPISRMISSGKPLISNVYVSEPEHKKLLYILVPLKDKNGNYVGVAGGEIDPTSPALSNILKLTDLGPRTFIDVIDSNGIVIASSKPSRALTYCDYNKFFSSIINSKKERIAKCHQCHDVQRKKRSTNIVAFVPLEMAPWGVAIQDPEEDVFAPSRNLKNTFFVLAFIFILTALILAFGISRSVVNPIRELIKATDRLARGDMSRPVLIKGGDEIGILSKSFETMRVKLAKSLEDIKNHNIELEQKIKERTKEIKESRKMVENLLKKIITTQEEERRRIARELHDDTMQNLSAILMNIDMCMLYPENITRDKIEGVRHIAVRTLDGVQSIIQNLRPTILDDLGLEASVRWLLHTHLSERNINYFFDISGADGVRFAPEIETNLFRIVQEAIINVAKHAMAENVIVNMDITDKGLSLLIEDDGRGFDVKSVLRSTRHYKKDGRGLGLLGMKERASLIGGSLLLCSEYGNGTRISLDVPIKEEGNDKDKCSDSG